MDRYNANGPVCLRSDGKVRAAAEAERGIGATAPPPEPVISHLKNKRERRCRGGMIAMLAGYFPCEGGYFPGRQLQRNLCQVA